MGFGYGAYVDFNAVSYVDKVTCTVGARQLSDRVVLLVSNDVAKILKKSG